MNSTKPDVIGRPFQPGQSGNPRGRPKVLAEVRELARDNTVLAIETLAEICRTGDKDAARVAAATALLDRGWGKAIQSIEVGGRDGSPIVVAGIDLSRLDTAKLTALHGLLSEARVAPGIDKTLPEAQPVKE